MSSHVFIHTNHKQMVGALVGQYALKRNSKQPDRFDVTIIDTKDHDFLKAKEGQPYLRDRNKRARHFDDLQSFTPLRFNPPEKPDGSALKGWMNRMRRRLFGESGLLGHYESHPDQNQERFFFGLLRKCIDQGLICEEMLRAETRQNHVRHDAFEVLDRTPKLAA